VIFPTDLAWRSISCAAVNPYWKSAPDAESAFWLVYSVASGILVGWIL
jgi:hypothetical protein